MVQNSKPVSIQELFFSKLKSNRTVLIECDAGYTTIGSASGPVYFEVECLASGDFQPGGVLECLPVECVRAHDVSHSTNSGGNRTTVFGETVVCTCDGGYYVNFTKNQSPLEAEVF